MQVKAERSNSGEGRGVNRTFTDGIRAGTDVRAEGLAVCYGRLTIRLHTAPCLLCRSGVSLTWSGVTMAVPIRSHCEDMEKPKPAKHIEEGLVMCKSHMQINSQSHYFHD